MSFALEFRKKMQAEARAERVRRWALEQANSGYVVLPAEESEETRCNRRRVLAALSLAALVLFVFNSGALVRYTGDLSETIAGRYTIELAERWHGLMEEHRMTRVVEEIRGAVMEARHSRWQDLASGWLPLVVNPLAAEEESAPPATPAADEPPSTPDTGAAPSPPGTGEPPDPTVKETAPAGPVLRAAIEKPTTSE